MTQASTCSTTSGSRPRGGTAPTWWTRHHGPTTRTHPNPSARAVPGLAQGTPNTRFSKPTAGHTPLARSCHGRGGSGDRRRRFVGRRFKRRQSPSVSAALRSAAHSRSCPCLPRPEPRSRCSRRWPPTTRPPAVTTRATSQPRWSPSPPPDPAPPRVVQMMGRVVPNAAHVGQPRRGNSRIWRLPLSCGCQLSRPGQVRFNLRGAAAAWPRSS
jgi:hypothetical protein